MQYREQGKKIQVLAYAGYNKEKKRAEVKMVGSFDRYTFEPSDGLMDALTVEQQKELNDKISEMKKQLADNRKNWAMTRSVDSLIDASASIDSGETFSEAICRLDADRAAKVWASMIALEKELTAAGYDKPKRKYTKRTQKTENKNELLL